MAEEEKSTAQAQATGRAAAAEPLVLGDGEAYEFLPDLSHIRVNVTWLCKSRSQICDLDLVVYLFDERARFLEKLDVSNRVSRDVSCMVLGDVDGFVEVAGSYMECVKMNLDLISPGTSAILLMLDGGSRNFQHVASVTAETFQVPGTAQSTCFANIADDDSMKARVLFRSSTKCKKDFQALALCTLYRVGWHPLRDPHSEGDPARARWVSKCTMEPFFLTAAKAKEERINHMVVCSVPALEKFRPRLFDNVRAICAALSSQVLPLLKRKFANPRGGLLLHEFIDTLFRQLYETHPMIADEAEAPYAVAMIEELFSQIDFNGDGTVDWDEFTTFTIALSVASAESKYKMDEYTIEYTEDPNRRDTYLSPHRRVAQMRYAPSIKKIIVVEDDAEHAVIFNEDFSLYTKVMQSRILRGNESKGKAQEEEAHTGLRGTINDLVYLPCRDLYAMCASDHSIAVFREQGLIPGRDATYKLHNKIYHSCVHTLLCWSDKAQVLCSVASDRVMYGWDVDVGTGSTPLFAVQRHNEIITDLLAVDELDVFVSCSMDRRIVMWSSLSKRVKGVLQGHRRGVRSLDVHGTTLLSSGFECEAKLWDLVSKENYGVLMGHRRPIAAARLMCKLALSDADQRAVTVDETGELRLWSIFVRDRIGDVKYLPTLQCFQMQNPSPPLDRISFLAFPGNPQLSTGYYSDLVACSSKMMRFIPLRSAKEFIAPTATIYIDAISCAVCAVGRDIIKYDVCTGNIMGTLANVHSVEVTELCMDGREGKRLYLGTANGEVVLINFILGTVLHDVRPHTREVTCMVNHKVHRSTIYSGSIDGSIAIIEEVDGEMHIHTILERAFGKGAGPALAAACIKLAPSVRAVVATSVGPTWGVWRDLTLKKILKVTEQQPVTAVELIGASGDAHEKTFLALEQSAFRLSATQVNARAKELLLTLAVALADGSINIYTVDTLDSIGVKAITLACSRQIYVTSMVLLRSPESNLVNYSSTRRNAAAIVGLQLVAGTDDGAVAVWDANSFRIRADQIFRDTYQRNVSSPTGAIASHSGGFGGNPLSPVAVPGLPRMASATTSKITVTDINSEELISSFDSDLSGIRESHMWTAHHDSISQVDGMEEHGCFVTASYDGFVRIWNIDDECLGEFPLPNLSEKQKDPPFRIVDNTTWKFILEKIAVNESHTRTAKTLLAALHRSSLPERSSRPGTRARSPPKAEPFSLLGVELPQRPSTEENTLRGAVLKEMREPPAVKSEESQFTRYLVHDSSTVDAATAASPTSKKTAAKKARSLWSTLDEIIDSAPTRAYITPAAFSVDSLAQSHYDRMIDGEGHKILTALANTPGKTSSYEKLGPVLLLRNPSMSTNITVPRIDNINRSEIKFGVQSSMYRNADIVINQTDTTPKKFIVHAVAMAKIEHHVKEVGSMVVKITPFHSEDAPAADASSASEIDPSQPSHAPPEAGVLRMAHVNRLIEKVRAACEDGENASTPSAPPRARRKGAFALSRAQQEALEKKVTSAIRDCYAERGGKEKSSVEADKAARHALTTRALLPFYRADDVKNFMSVFHKVDQDFSGDLDIDEWVTLFGSVNQSMTAQEARLIFLKVDKNGDGNLSLRELLPIVFSKASKEQIALITKFAYSEILLKAQGITFLTRSEVDQLFELYDEGVGYVSVGLLRTRVRALGLGEGVLYRFLDAIFDISDDEMLNLKEFCRIFKPFTQRD